MALYHQSYSNELLKVGSLLTTVAKAISTFSVTEDEAVALLNPVLIQFTTKRLEAGLAPTLLAVALGCAQDALIPLLKPVCSSLHQIPLDFAVHPVADLWLLWWPHVLEVWMHQYPAASLYCPDTLGSPCICRIQSLTCFSSTCVIHTWWDGGPGITFPFPILISAWGSSRAHPEALSYILPHPSRSFPYWADVTPVADPFLHYLSKAPQSLIFFFLPSHPPFLSLPKGMFQRVTTAKAIPFYSQFFFSAIFIISIYSCLPQTF